MTRIPPVCLLLANIAGADLSRIPDPDLVAQPLQQLDRPLAVAAGFHANQRRSRQSTVKSFCLSVPVDQLVLRNLSGFAVQNCHLLPTRMEITTYNNHGGFS